VSKTTRKRCACNAQSTLSLGGSQGFSENVNGLAEKGAEKIEERMRDANPLFQRRYMRRGDGFPPRALFSWDHHGMNGGRDEIGPSYEGSSEVSRSIGFVVRGLWRVNSWNDCREANDTYSEDDNRPTQILHLQNPKLPPE
jgi:hypothetical protein